MSHKKQGDVHVELSKCRHLFQGCFCTGTEEKCSACSQVMLQQYLQSLTLNEP